MKDIDRIFFLPMSDVFRDPENTRHEEEQHFAESLHERYNAIPIIEFEYLIDYTDIALLFASGAGVKLWDQDRASFASMEKEPFNIDRIVLEGCRTGESQTMSFEIISPYIIDQVHNLLKELFDYLPVKNEKQPKKKRPSAEILKLIGTEIFNALRSYRISKWKAECILGQIMGFYQIGLKIDEPVMTEQEHSDHNAEMRGKNIPTESYLSYCRGQGKNYHY